MGSLQASDDRLGHLNRLLDEIQKEASSDEELRKQLVETLQEHSHRADTPGDFVWRTLFSTHQYATLRTAMAMKLPNILADEVEPLTADELAKKAGADRLLVG